jgi:hypothetical protein
MHHTCIKNYDLKRLNPKKLYVYKLGEGQDGLYLERAGVRKSDRKWVEDNSSQRIGVRRILDND